MVREFSEEKRQEIFRMLDEIDQREWKSFMEWCGSRAEEFGDWPDKLAVSAYTRYVDEYHEKVLEINEMTRQQVNTVFENVAEIDARYAARMRECQEKIKEQIAIVRTMTEFMDSMADGKPNMALITEGSANESIRTEEKAESRDEPSKKLPDKKIIKHILEKADGKLSDLSTDEIKTAIFTLKMLVSAPHKGGKEGKGYTRNDIGKLCKLFENEYDIWKIILGSVLAPCVAFLSPLPIRDYYIGMFMLLHASRTESKESDYVGVYYLNKEDGAFGQGHTALLFVREDGSGVFYSFAGNEEEALGIILTFDVTGYLSRTELTEEEVGVFLAGPTMEEYLNNAGEGDTVDLDTDYKKRDVRKDTYITVPCQGIIFTDYMDVYHYDGGEGNPYNRTIYIPLSDEQGDRMVELAEELYRDTPDYNLFENNCGMVAQQILAEGNADFAAASGSAMDERIAILGANNPLGMLILDGVIINDLWFDETRPNVAYAHGEKMAEENGYAYGSLEEVYREVNEGGINGDDGTGE